MSFDALTLAAVRDELEPVLTGARMQKLVFVDELSLAVEFFAPSVGRTNVLLSAHLEHGRVQRIGQLPTRGLERDTPFSLLVRKHLRNARVGSVRQPPLERVFELDCEQRDSSNRPYRVIVIVEAMGRRSNLVLVDHDGVIVDAARRTPQSRNARRPILPHLPYAPPPPQDRLAPEAITPEALSCGEPLLLAKRLGERVAGLSPLAAREVAFRAAGALDASTSSVDWSEVARTVRSFVTTREWNPTVAYNPGGEPLEYAPYELTHLAATGARLERFSSISDAMTAYYAAAPARRGDPLAAERKALLAPLERATQTTRRRIAALEHQLSTAASERDSLRLAGEHLLAQQADVEAGAAHLQVDGQLIELDPHLSAVENAQAYFARYRKAREAEERVPELLEEARRSVEYLSQLTTLVELADQMDAIRALRREVAQATGSSSRERKQYSKATPYRRVALDGWEALVGTSAEGNSAVTFDVARPEDLWLHARGVPGAHVILRGADPPQAIVERAAQLAASHSAARTAGAVEVDVTPRRYVKKIPGGPPGLVRYANERTVRVSPRND
jgi:predicted ribosome quality control (RQC) complex YloA/Tae2 family protein